MSRLIDGFILKVDLAVSKLLRPLLSDAIDSERISQAFFRSLAGELNELFGKEVVQYVQSDYVRDFLHSNQISNSTRIVLIGGADIDFNCSDLKPLLTYKNVTFFIQHLDCKESETIKFLPIGIEDLSRARNGLPWHFPPFLQCGGKTRRLLVGPFKITDQSRQELLEVAENLSNATVLRRRLASFIYSRIAAKHQFVACPRGAGIDTHRFWESIYRGSIPIVVDSEWVCNLETYSIPHVTLPDWNALKSFDSDSYGFELGDMQSFLSPQWWRERLICLAAEEELSE